MELPKGQEELDKLVIRLMEENGRLRDRIKELEEILKRRKINPPPAIKPSTGKDTDS
jgi:hypothetical protein